MKVVLNLRFRYDSGGWNAILAIYGKNRVKILGMHMMDSRRIGLCKHEFRGFSDNSRERHRITMRYLPFFHDHIDEIRTYLTSSRSRPGPYVLGRDGR